MVPIVRGSLFLFRSAVACATVFSRFEDGGVGGSAVVRGALMRGGAFIPDHGSVVYQPAGDLLGCVRCAYGLAVGVADVPHRVIEDDGSVGPSREGVVVGGGVGGWRFVGDGFAS